MTTQNVLFITRVELATVDESGVVPTIQGDPHIAKEAREKCTSRPKVRRESGLARAFFYAGARSLVVSNWEVDSESTVALMTGMFHALKADPHLTRAEGLRLSMLRMIDNASKPEWAQPKFWAPFVVVGEPQKN